MELPLISIVIPCFNQGQYIEEAIKSVWNSIYPNYEIIVVDDGSTDPVTQDIIVQLQTYHHVTVISQSNRGLPAARNTGIEASMGEYIVPLDADDVLDPTFLKKAAWRLLRSREIGIVYSLVKLFGDVDYLWITEEFHPTTLLHHNYIPATAMFRRLVWTEVGGYDETMRMGYEDWEYWIRCVIGGWKAERINEPLFFYRRHGHSMLHDSRKRHTEIVRFIRKKHRSAFRLSWRVSLLSIYARKRVSRALGRLRQYVINKLSPQVITAVKRAKQKIRPKRPEFIQKRRCVAGKYVLKQVADSDPRIGVVIVLPWLRIGGVESVILNLLSELDRSSFRMYLFTTVPSEHPWEQKFANLVDGIYHLGTICDNPQDRVDFLCDFIEVNTVACMHISNSELGYAALPAVTSEFPGLFVFDTLHMEEPNEPWDYFRLSESAQAYLRRRVVITKTLRDRLISGYGESPDRVVVIENGISIPPIKQPADSFCKRDAIVFIGRLIQQKQPLQFVSIAERLVKEYPSLKFLIVGAGPLRQAVEKRIQSAGLGENIELIEPSSVQETLSTRALLLVAPSEREGLPVVGLESMAFHVPIIASDVPGWRDLITSGLNGILVEDGNISAFCKEIQRLIFDLDLRTQLADEAYVTLNRWYSASRMSQLYQELYRTDPNMPAAR